MLSFAPGLGAVPWAMNSEIYSSRIWGAARGIATTANWVANIVVSKTFLTMVHRVGPVATFNLYATLALTGGALAWRYMPEAKGLTMEQVRVVFGTADPLRSW